MFAPNLSCQISLFFAWIELHLQTRFNATAQPGMQSEYRKLCVCMWVYERKCRMHEKSRWFFFYYIFATLFLALNFLAHFSILRPLRTTIILNIESAIIVHKFRVYVKFRFPREFCVSDDTFARVIEESRESGVRLTEGFPRGYLSRNWITDQDKYRKPVSRKKNGRTNTICNKKALFVKFIYFFLNL